MIGPYRILRRIGRGGMAEVFLGVVYGASGFEKHAAIKRLLSPFRTLAEYERLLIEEAKLGARLCHQNLVETYELGVDGGSYYCAMQLVDGGDLESLTRVAPLPRPLVWLVAEEVALALDYIHRAKDEKGRPLGLIHRDISPSNVLVSKAGEVKLADFGLAKATLLAEVTRPNVRKGKYAYMSPEQVEGQSLSPSSDQFGLGVMTAELLTGKRPFDGATIPETLENIRRAKIPELPGLSSAEIRVISRCLAAKPSERFVSPEELRSAIAGVRAGIEPASAAALGAWADQAARPGASGKLSS